MKGPKIKEVYIKTTAKISRYYHTLVHLKWTQIRYQFYYILRRKLGWQAKLSSVNLPASFGNFSLLKLQESIPAQASFIRENHFQFLNILHDFKAEIDWNFAQHGKLWTYNLNYFEFLSQPNVDKETGLSLIKIYIEKGATLKDGLEPFPISLRTIFWIKFLVKYEVQDTQIDTFLYRQTKLLQKQIEYHLLGNHLLENSFALLFAAYYFSDNQLFKQAKKILEAELNEQILSDGSHFELTPMYHQLMLYRLLDSINLIKNNPKNFPSDWLNFLTEKAEKMLVWSEYMTFSDGIIPHFNDSTDGIAPTPQELKKYAQRLKIVPQTPKDFHSLNYHKYQSKQYEIFIDIGDIGPDYIPGHAHSDNLHFVLQSHGKPVLVDTGISTYEKDQKRHFERSTAAHNTVQIKNREQSDVWGGFRVGRRANSLQKEIKPNYLELSHDGYRFMNIQHKRSFKMEENTIEIIDKLSSPSEAKARFHFHPSIQISKESNTLLGDFGTISFEGSKEIKLEKYQFALGYNKTRTATVVLVHFNQVLLTKIQLS